MTWPVSWTRPGARPRLGVDERTRKAGRVLLSSSFSQARPVRSGTGSGACSCSKQPGSERSLQADVFPQGSHLRLTRSSRRRTTTQEDQASGAPKTARSRRTIPHRASSCAPGGPQGTAGQGAGCCGLAVAGSFCVLTTPVGTPVIPVTTTGSSRSCLAERVCLPSGCTTGAIRRPVSRSPRACRPAW